jgi:hypothetical protein
MSDQICAARPAPAVPSTPLTWVRCQHGRPQHEVVCDVHGFVAGGIESYPRALAAAHRHERSHGRG